MITEISKLFKEVQVEEYLLKMLYVSRDRSMSIVTKNPNLNKATTVYIPVFWATYKDEMIYGVCDYTFDMFEDFNDWVNESQFIGVKSKPFNHISPGIDELLTLKKYFPRYFTVDYNILMNSDHLEDLCEWEIDILKTWNRDKKLNQILNEESN